MLPRVLNIAQALVKLSVNATCWKVAAPKVASKSSERPAAKVALVPAMDTTPGLTQVGGRVRDAVDPREVWEESTVDGDCRLTLGPDFLCDPRCATGENCVAENVCMAPPSSVDVGVVTIDGLGVEAMITPNPATFQYYFAPPSGMAYPPFEPGAPLTLAAAGGGYAPFMLRGEGIAPLEVSAANLAIETFLPADATSAARLRGLADARPTGA